MISFKLNGQALSLPATWAEVPRPLLPQLAACRLEPRTMALQLRWLQLLTGVPVATLRRIEPDTLRRLAGQLDWVWTSELPGALITDFEHLGQRFYLVEPTLANCTLAEYTVADHHVRQFLQHQVVEALPQLVATVCRPERRGLDRLDPAWDGDDREPFNARITQDRAAGLATLPLGVQQLVLAHFVAGQARLQALYPKLFAAGGSGSADGSEPAGSPLIELAYSLADAGIFGTFEKVLQENIYTVLEYLESNLRKQE